MAAASLRHELEALSADMKFRIGDLLDKHREGLAPEHGDLLQEISFKVGLLTSVIADRELATADVDRQWVDHLAMRANRRIAKQRRWTETAGK